MARADRESKTILGVMNAISVVDEATSPAPLQTLGLVASSTTDHSELAAKVHDEPISWGAVHP